MSYLAVAGTDKDIEMITAATSLHHIGLMKAIYAH
ncbi:hypothetical protein OMCYN_01808 [cyanobiont of Ornithocercus magnificus]|nr:hypothetical protein OMCYN_01808 [cyanobiont of Ornithocercus magnificus]